MSACKLKDCLQKEEKVQKQKRQKKSQKDKEKRRNQIGVTK